MKPLTSTFYEETEHTQPVGIPVGMRALLSIRMPCRKESGPDSWRGSTESLLEVFFVFKFLPEWTPEKSMSPGWAALGPFLRVLASVP